VLADKHPAYQLLQGPSGHGVDDLYTPEINAITGTLHYLVTNCVSII
jgi:hypothetical protein